VWPVVLVVRLIDHMVPTVTCCGAERDWAGSGWAGSGWVGPSGVGDGAGTGWSGR